MVLDHVQHIIECIRKKKQPEPMRLLLLGTAGSGKTRSVQTVLQELQRALAAVKLPTDVDREAFVRVGAPTGTAAFNLRFSGDYYPPLDSLVYAAVLPRTFAG